jgi:hypothetical protein
MIELIVIGMLSTLSFISLSFVVFYKIKNTKLIETTTQLLLNQQVLSEEIDRLNFIVNNSTDLENGFIKFLSESREEAFRYIEDVQISIADLAASLDSGNEEKISASYKNLIDYLPQEIPND